MDFLDCCKPAKHKPFFDDDDKFDEGDTLFDAPNRRESSKGDRCCSPMVCCKACCIACCILFLILIPVYFGVMYSMEDPCFVYEAEAAMVSPREAQKVNVNPPVNVGTRIPPHLPSKSNQDEMPPDLSGIWWIRWTNWTANPTGWNGIHWNRLTYGIYSALKIEELVSFKGAKVNSSQFPLEVSSKTGHALNWGFTNSLASRIGMNVAADKNPNGSLNLYFENKTHARVGGFNGVAFMTNLDEDRWLRSTLVNGHRYGPPAYQLTRIVYEDGSVSQHFQSFLDHMGSTKIRVFSNNDQCERKAGVAPRISKACEPIEKQCAEGVGASAAGAAQAAAVAGGTVGPQGGMLSFSL